MTVEHLEESTSTEDLTLSLTNEEGEEVSKQVFSVYKISDRTFIDACIECNYEIITDLIDNVSYEVVCEGFLEHMFYYRPEPGVIQRFDQDLYYLLKPRLEERNNNL